MSLEAMLWAAKDAPTIDAEERLLLIMMAEAADSDGCNSHKSQPTLARLTHLNDRTVRRRLEALEERGLIARGDQQVVAYIRADSRPVNWDLQIPCSYFRNVDRINQERWDARRWPPLTPEARPDLASAPDRKARVDKGTPKPRKPAPDDEPQTATGLEDRPDETGNTGAVTAGLQDRPVSEAATGGLEVQSDRTSSPPTLSLTLSLNPPPPDTGKAGEEEGQSEPPNLAAARTLLNELTRQLQTHRQVRPSMLGRLARVVAEHMDRGWTVEALRGHHALGGSFDGADVVGAVLATRIRELGDPPAPARQRPVWCGDPTCHEQTRMRVRPDSLDGKPVRCPACHPLSAAGKAA